MNKQILTFLLAVMFSNSLFSKNPFHNIKRSGREINQDGFYTITSSSTHNAVKSNIKDSFDFTKMHQVLTNVEQPKTKAAFNFDKLYQALITQANQVKQPYNIKLAHRAAKRLLGAQHPHGLLVPRVLFPRI
ncbi:MAG: hypothetical protein EBU90_09445 [Proteobacteria bacterium]|nr:hypothetical protein [Pseudomonadota bacterium]NBP14929.1 hypothetical protein [bacterium]